MSNQELLPWLSMVSNGWNRPIKVGQIEPEAIIVVLSSIPHLIHTLTILVIAMRLQFVRIYLNLHHQKMSNVKTQVAFGHIFSQGLESVFIDGEVQESANTFLIQDGQVGVFFLGETFSKIFVWYSKSRTKTRNVIAKQIDMKVTNIQKFTAPPFV